MKKESLATGGAIGASLLIASCCLAPALFLLFGISVSALGALTSLEPYRPAFIAAGGLALFYAGWRIYRADPLGRDAVCTEETCAPDSTGRRRIRRLFGAAVGLYLVAIGYPYLIEALI